MTRPDKRNNTIQIRFAPVSMPLCLMVINNHAFSDPYIFSQEVKDGKKNNLFYNYPLSYFDKNREEDKEYFDYLTNHFDYLWNLDITMLCRDATYYDLQTHPQGLMDIRTPDKVIWNQKRARIESYLKDLKEKNIIKTHF